MSVVYKFGLPGWCVNKDQLTLALAGILAGYSAIELDISARRNNVHKQEDLHRDWYERPREGRARCHVIECGSKSFGRVEHSFQIYPGTEFVEVYRMDQ